MDVSGLGQLLPLAVGIIISPLPIVAIVAILLSRRGRANGFAYAGATTLVGFAFTLIAALTTSGASSGGGATSTVIVTVLAGVLALGFGALAVVSWLGRPKAGAEPKMPGWLAAVDTMTPGKAAGLGAIMAVTNSKNIPLQLKAGALIGAHHLPVAAVIGVCVLFALVAAAGILLPTLLAAGGSALVRSALERLKTEMVRHNAIIMTVLFALLAAVEAGHVITHLVH